MIDKDYEDIIVRQEGHVLLLTLNRPEILNAFTDAMVAEVYEVLTTAQRDESVRVLVLTGAGRAFTSGGRAGSIISRFFDDPDQKRTWREHILSGAADTSLQHFHDFQKPLIAAVNGPAAGAGFALALMCDLRVFSTEARVGSIYSKRGTITPQASYYLPRIAWLGAACEHIFKGELITAAEAHEMGLVNRLVSPDQVVPVAMELAQRIAQGPPLATRLAKKLLYDGLTMDFDSVKKESVLARTLAINITNEMREGFGSFKEKRSPKF